jgi:hypothetical protein
MKIILILLLCISSSLAGATGATEARGAGQSLRSPGLRNSAPTPPDIPDAIIDLQRVKPKRRCGCLRSLCRFGKGKSGEPKYDQVPLVPLAPEEIKRRETVFRYLTENNKWITVLNFILTSRIAKQNAIFVLTPYQM